MRVLSSDDDEAAVIDVCGDNLNCSHVNDVADCGDEAIFLEPSAAEDLLPEWDSSWDSIFDIGTMTVGTVDVTEGAVDDACQTLAAAVACPGVGHNAHKALRLSLKPKVKAKVKVKAKAKAKAKAKVQNI